MLLQARIDALEKRVAKIETRHVLEDQTHEEANERMKVWDGKIHLLLRMWRATGEKKTARPPIRETLH